MAVYYVTATSGTTSTAQVALNSKAPLAILADSHAGNQVFVAFGVDSGGPFARMKAAGGLDLAVISGPVGWGQVAVPITRWMRLEQGAATVAVRSFQVWTT